MSSTITTVGYARSDTRHLNRVRIRTKSLLLRSISKGTVNDLDITVLVRSGVVVPRLRKGVKTFPDTFLIGLAEGSNKQPEDGSVGDRPASDATKNVPTDIENTAHATHRHNVESSAIVDSTGSWPDSPSGNRALPRHTIIVILLIRRQGGALTVGGQIRVLVCVRVGIGVGNNNSGHLGLGSGCTLLKRS